MQSKCGNQVSVALHMMMAHFFCKGQNDRGKYKEIAINCSCDNKCLMFVISFNCILFCYLCGKWLWSELKWSYSRRLLVPGVSLCRGLGDEKSCTDSSWCRQQLRWHPDHRATSRSGQHCNWDTTNVCGYKYCLNCVPYKPLTYGVL